MSSLRKRIRGWYEKSISRRYLLFYLLLLIVSVALYFASSLLPSACRKNLKAVFAVLGYLSLVGTILSLACDRLNALLGNRPWRPIATIVVLIACELAWSLTPNVLGLIHVSFSPTGSKELLAEQVIIFIPFLAICFMFQILFMAEQVFITDKKASTLNALVAALIQFILQCLSDIPSDEVSKFNFAVLQWSGVITGLFAAWLAYEVAKPESGRSNLYWKICSRRQPQCVCERPEGDVATPR